MTSFMRRVSFAAVCGSAHQVDMCTGPVNTTCMSMPRSSMSAICSSGSRNLRRLALGGAAFLPKPVMALWLVQIARSSSSSMWVWKSITNGTSACFIVVFFSGRGWPCLARIPVYRPLPASPALLTKRPPICLPKDIAMRPSRRAPDELRAVSLERGVVKYAEGSCFVKFGDTHVLVTATLEDRLPPWLKGQARGWITAEYGMLPRATLERTRREAAAGKQNGRTIEIQRLIGRSLRVVVDLEALGERQITIDCDVIQADGGTRTAAITGAWVALHDCLVWMKTRDIVRTSPLREHVAAISCGICAGTAVLDLDYAEDSSADTDANFVLTGSGGIVEIQTTAEKVPFTEPQLLTLLALARKGVGKLIELQKIAVM